MTGADRTLNEKLVEEFEWAVRRHNDLSGGPHVLEVRKTREAVLVRMVSPTPTRDDPLPPHNTRVLVWYRDGHDWWISKRVLRNGQDAWSSAGGYCAINKVVTWRPLPTVPGEP